MNYNYIKHLNTWFVIYKQSEVARPLHASLYFCLFQLWNINRFPDGFYVTRSELMTVAKIASSSTYGKALKDMVAWGWIDYKAGNTFFGCSHFRIATWKELEQKIVADGEIMYPIISTPTDGITTTPTCMPTTNSTATPTNAPSIEPSSKRLYKTSKQVKQVKEINNLNNNYNEPL